MKRFLSILFLIVMALFVSSALALSIPSASDGCWAVSFTRRELSCSETACRQTCGLGCVLCESDSSCPACPLCGPCFYTAIPLETPAARSTPTVLSRPTPMPAAACCSASVPTYRPVQQSISAQPTEAAETRRTAAPTAQPTVSTGDYTTLSISAQEQKLLNLVNQDRAANGLPPLTLDPELSSLARLKACDMSQNHYFAHESPTYGSAAEMLTQFGYDYNGVGENIAHHATVEKAEAAFLSSDGHRRNIMGSQWDRVGIGVCTDENGYVYVTELFAR